VIALIDINNCYVSCERVFQPELNNKPVIVLSNNDGCAIARSAEAKSIGIKMGQPVYQIAGLIKQHGVKIRSANFALYGDMSHRMMTIIAELTPKIQIYSIDECFVDATGISRLEDWAKYLKKTIYQWTGLPVSIGVGRTKVFSKLANRLAKSGSGVYVIKANDERDVLLSTPVGDIWGIGKKTSDRLISLGIYTADQFTRHPDQAIREQFSVVLSRIKAELCGKSVLALDDHIETKQQIICSRSFGEVITGKDHLQQALVHFALVVTEKLRRQNSEAGCLQITLDTNPYSQSTAQYHRAATVSFPTHTASTSLIIKYAGRLLDQLFKAGYEYKRAGVMLSNIAPTQMRQFDLLAIQLKENEALDNVKDSINQRFGNQKILPARLLHQDQPWRMHQNKLSNKFTTKWSDLIKAS
jgi:DNA polymerase V